MKKCNGTINNSFVACGEDPDLYGYCSTECENKINSIKPVVNSEVEELKKLIYSLEMEVLFLREEISTLNSSLVSISLSLKNRGLT